MSPCSRPSCICQHHGDRGLHSTLVWNTNSFVFALLLIALSSHDLQAMEALSCGTPMLAANAQGYAMYLSHGVNVSQLGRSSVRLHLYNGLFVEGNPLVWHRANRANSPDLGKAFHAGERRVFRQRACRDDGDRARRKLVPGVCPGNHGCAVANMALHVLAR